MTAIYRPCWILLFCFVLSGCFVMLWEQCVLLFDCVLCWINQFLVISAPPVLPGEHSEIAERGPCRRNCCSSRRWTDYITASFFFLWNMRNCWAFILEFDAERDETHHGWNPEWVFMEQARCLPPHRNSLWLDPHQVLCSGADRLRQILGEIRRLVPEK